MSVQTKITQYIANSKVITAFNLYIIAMIVPLGAFLFHLIENFDWLFNPLFDTPPDYMFYVYILTVIVGSYACYRLTHFYFELGSTDYLLLAYYCFAVVIWAIMNNIWGQYLSPWQSYCVTQNPEFWRLYPEWIIIRQPYWWIPVLLFLHVVRLKGWDSFNQPMKVLIIILLIDTVLSHPIGDISTHLVHWQTRLFFPYNVPYYESLWYLKHSLTAVLFTWTYGIFVEQILIFVFFLYAYVTLNPKQKTLSIQISQIGWICIAIIYIFMNIVIISDYLDSEVPDLYLAIYNTFYFFQGISIIIIMSILLLIPETLLISKYQLFKATKLYTFIESIPEQKTEPSLPWDLLSYKARVKEYVLSLPSDILTEIGLDSNHKGSVD